jgi:hypothetical protein
MDLFANWEPLMEERDREGTTDGLESSDGLVMAMPINLGEGFFRDLKFPMDIKKAAMAMSYMDTATWLLGMIRFSMKNHGVGVRGYQLSTEMKLTRQLAMQTGTCGSNWLN